ncbi:hypothetical protein Taro_028722 [Colocasia esculenta]|uniref:Uncharacterized protein n=1 Tax=Colocasia esculenta TaxID=4460 RepID=A0A843VSR5_COLES|nr:hypothetical protein [Colocasia esculenta]
MTLYQNLNVLIRNPMSGLTPVRVRRRPPDRDCPICRLLGSDCDSLPVATKKATGEPSRSQNPICKPCRDPLQALSLPALPLSQSLLAYVAFTGFLTNDLYTFLAISTFHCSRIPLERRAPVFIYTLYLACGELSVGYSFRRTSEPLHKASVSLLCPWIPTWSTSWLYPNTYDTL